MGLINEINRIKTIMGIRLLVEGGGVLGDLGDFFSKLLTKNVDELSVEERELAERMIKNSTELQSAGIKNLDQALSPQGKLILKNTIKNSKENVINALRKSIDDYSQETIRIVNKNLESIQTFKSSLKNAAAPKGSLLDVFKTIENKGLSNYEPEVLVQIQKKIKAEAPNYASDPEVAKYFKDIDDSIGTYINSKNVDFGKQIDDLAIEVVDEFKVVMGKDDLLRFIDDEFPGNTAMKNDIEKISEVDLKKSQDEFNKLSDEEVDNAINKVCGTLKESLGKDWCGMDVKEIKQQTKAIAADTERKSALTGNIEATAALRRAQSKRVLKWLKWVLTGGALIALGVGGYYGVKAVNNLIKQDGDTETPEGEPGDIDKL